jgi:HEAT repeat protein
MFRRAAYPESAIPLAAAVTDPIDQIQFEAIAGELNIFLAERAVPDRRGRPVTGDRNQIDAEPAFSIGPLALNAHPVPVEVLTALSAAIGDDNPLVTVEALYALGTLSIDASGSFRRELLRANSPRLAGMLGASDARLRLAAARVTGRLFERRPGDAAIDESLGDAVIALLNDRGRELQLAAMDALGAMRYDRAVQALIDLHQYYRRNAPGLGALGALARIGHKTSADVFRNELSTGNADTRVLAIEGLARLGDSASVETIRSALVGERNQSVLLAESFARVVLSGGSIDPLIDALRRAALRDRALGYLVEAAPGRSSAFSRVRQDPDEGVRAAIADALGLAHDPAALPIVTEMRKDSNPLVARAAERAASRLRPRP